MSSIRITVGPHTLLATLHEAHAPTSCAAFRQMLPLRRHLLHARWSGASMWVPLDELPPGVRPEHATCYPSPGQLLLYAGDLSEPEILIPYGPTHFASKAGALAGNHFMTVTGGASALETLGHQALWTGAHEILFELAPATAAG